MSFLAKAHHIFSSSLDSGARSLQRYRGVFLTFAVVGSSGALYRHYFYDWGLSHGPSMYPTQPDDKHLVFFDNRCRKGRGVKIGDIVQAAHPQFPNELVNKRVIGLPGDYVVRDPAQSASVGGAVVRGVTDWKERAHKENPDADAGRETGEDAAPVRQEPEMIRVPEGHAWVVGDNLAWSRDSRVYGPLPLALIRARSTRIFDGVFSTRSLEPGKGLRKVEDWEMDYVLGNKDSNDTHSETNVK